MSNTGRNILLLIFPFFLMILVNEISRPTIHEKPYQLKGISAMNSNIRTPEKCSWNCHNETRYCLDHHTRLFKPYAPIISPIYFGMISMLASTGNYGLANIVFLVVLWPLFMLLLLIKNLNLYQKLSRLKK